MADLEREIRENAAGPKSAEVDGQRVEQHSLKDQIAADGYLARKAAARSRTCGVKFTKMVAPGA